jgi:hypothetical protein
MYTNILKLSACAIFVGNRSVVCVKKLTNVEHLEAGGQKDDNQFDDEEEYKSHLCVSQ